MGGESPKFGGAFAENLEEKAEFEKRNREARDKTIEASKILDDWTSEEVEARDTEKYGLTTKEELALALERSKYILEYYAKDSLTGAASLAEFTARLEQSLKEVGRGIPAALLYMDIDHFKKINDTVGHSGGDIVLKEVCALLMRSVRETDMVARIGGEEFAIILSGANGFSKVKAEELRKGVENLNFDEHSDLQGLSVTASFGVVSLDQSIDIETARKLADKALYQSKNGGRNQVTVFEP